MSRVGSPTHALILWDSRFSLDNVAPLGALTTESGYTEDAPIVPEPVAWGTDGARVYATGQPLTEAIEVEPFAAAVSSYRVSVNGTDDETYYAPYGIAGVALPYHTDGVTYNLENVGICTSRLGDVVVVGGANGERSLAVVLRDRAQLWSSTLDEIPGESYHAAVCLLPDGRLVATVISSGVDASTWESTDHGETWNRLTTAAFYTGDASISLQLGTLRSCSMAADGAGAICLLLQDDDGALQLYSADGGLSYVPLGRIEDVRSMRCFPLANGMIGIGYLTLESGAPTDDSAMYRRLGTAGQPIAASQAIEVDLITGASTSAHIAGCCGLDSRVHLYVWAEVPTAQTSLLRYQSQDYGQTWDGPEICAEGKSGGKGQRRIAATMAADGVALGGTDVDTDLSLGIGWVAYLGGWRGIRQSDFDTGVWYPWMSEIGCAADFTDDGSGNITHTRSNDQAYLAVDEESSYIATGSTVIVIETSQVTSTLGTFECGLEYRTATLRVQLRYFPDRIVVYDVVAASTLTTVTIDMTQRVLVEARVAGGFLNISYRLASSTVWLSTSSYLLTAGSVTGTAGWRWGTYAATGESLRVHWVQTSALGATLPTVERREPLPVWGQPAYGRGHVLRATAGLVRTTDTATLSPAYSHPLGAAFPDRSISPSSGWITEDDSQQQSIVFDFGAPIWVGDAVALAVLNARASTYFLAYYDGAAWQNVATLRLDSGFRVSGMTYASAGATIYPGASTTTADRWLIEGELAGGFALCGAEAIRILGNSAGLWASGSTGVRPTILLASAPSSATGDLRLCAPSGVAVAGLTSRTTARYWRVRVDNADASPGDQSGAGVIFVGRVLAFGAEPDWGWTEDDVPNVERANSPAGVPRQRALSLPLRRWGMSWSSGVLAWPIREGEDADYWSLDASHLPLVAVEDLRGVLRGALQTHQALPVIAVAGLADGTVTDPTLWVYGVLGTGGVGVRGVSGVEGEDEVYRVETLTVQEVR